jgi:hypothetical protein
MNNCATEGPWSNAYLSGTIEYRYRATSTSMGMLVTGKESFFQDPLRALGITSENLFVPIPEAGYP